MVTAASIFATVTPSPARAASAETLLLCEHTSDVLRGPPFNDRDEMQQEYCGIGATITAGKNSAWEIDLTHGLKRIDRGELEQGTQFAVRFYPGRLRRN